MGRGSRWAILAACAIAATSGTLFLMWPSPPTHQFKVVPLRDRLGARGLELLKSTGRVGANRVHAPHPAELNRILANGGSDPTTSERGPDLSAAQAGRLRSLLLSDETIVVVDGPQNSCWFHPDMQFLLFDENDEVAMSLTLCFTCREIDLVVAGGPGDVFGREEFFELARELYPEEKFGLGEE